MYVSYISAGYCLLLLQNVSGALLELAKNEKLREQELKEDLLTFDNSPTY